MVLEDYLKQLNEIDSKKIDKKIVKLKEKIKKLQEKKKNCENMYDEILCISRLNQMIANARKKISELKKKKIGVR